ncbi:hypothetical protein [Formosa haliotis]|nr:hypothetical protein [Formosa haliotis]
MVNKIMKEFEIVELEERLKMKAEWRTSLIASNQNERTVSGEVLVNF